MNKLISYLSQRADRIAVQRAEKDFIEGFDGGQSKREAMERRRAWRARMLPWGLAFIAAAGSVVQFMRR